MIEKEIKIESYDVQPNSIAKPSALQKYMQQIAREDLLQYGTTYYGMREHNQVFVIVKLAMEFYDDLRAEDRLNVRSWQKEVRGATYIREFEFKRGGTLAAACSTHWVLLDFVKRTIVKPELIKGRCESFPNDSVDIMPERRIITSEDKLTKIGTHTVAYCELDENMHLNNAVYADIAMNFAPVISGGIHPPICDLQINFAGEAKFGDVLGVYTATTEKGYKTRIIDEGSKKICADAVFSF